MKQEIIGAIKIVRPLNCLSALSITVLGGCLSRDLINPTLWMAGVVVAMLTAAGNVVNDYFDLEIDRINKPFRPLPSGNLEPSTVINLGFILTLTGLILSLFLGAIMSIIAVIVVVFSCLYSWKLKQTVFIGNLTVSVLSAMTIIYGGIAVNNIFPTLIPSVLILFFMLCREILKTIEDYEGDLLLGARTIAVIWGKTSTLNLFCVLALSVILLSPLPWLLGNITITYLLLVIPGIDVVLLVIILLLLKRPLQHIRTALVVTKINWILWTVAMFMGLGFM